MGQLATVANQLEKAAPAFLNSLEQMLKRKSENPENNPAEEPIEAVEEPMLNEGVNKKTPLIKEDYQLRNIKRLINKTER